MKILPTWPNGFRTYIPPKWRVASIILLVFATLLLIVSQFSVVESTNTPTTSRIAELEDNEQTLNLAIEFGFDPLIVKVVRQLSAQARQARQCACPTWRWVKSDDDLAYLILSIIQIESRGDYKAFNPGGPAYGLTQFVLSTARMYDRDVTTAELLTIPKHLSLSVNHFVDLLERAKGNPHLAVDAWNKGAGVIDRSSALGTPLESRYAHTVLTQAAMRNAQ